MWTFLRRLWLRFELWVAQLLFRLPGIFQLLLSGKRQVRIGDQALLPEVQLALTARRWTGGGALRAASAQQARRRLRGEILRYAGSPPSVHAVRDFSIPGPASQLPVRHYLPEPAGAPPPLLVYFHGGGFVTGDLDTHDGVCRLLCRDAQVQVLAVDYRLAPEHPFPAGVDDALAAFRWAQAHAAELGADPQRVCVGGDSAGGNLSAVVARLSAAEGSCPHLQLLIYPVLDRVSDYASLELFQEGFMLTRADMLWYDSLYTGDDRQKLADLRISPLLDEVPRGLCPALIYTAAFDPLRDEGEAYAAKLEAAGVPVQLRRVEGQIHGFVNMVGVSPSARSVVVHIAHDLRARCAVTSQQAA